MHHAMGFSQRGRDEPLSYMKVIINTNTATITEQGWKPFSTFETRMRNYFFMIMIRVMLRKYELKFCFRISWLPWLHIPSLVECSYKLDKSRGDFCHRQISSQKWSLPPIFNIVSLKNHFHLILERFDVGLGGRGWWHETHKVRQIQVVKNPQKFDMFGDVFQGGGWFISQGKSLWFEPDLLDRCDPGPHGWFQMSMYLPEENDL